ncbi:MAG: hypothetical protein JWN93_1714 [Hyphomicrobiales bacterium]|nr:hypothetical protein [Hyphomicrobiales bacterium]
MLPLFYTDVAAIERSRDGARRVAYGPDRFGFCARSHLAPCLAVEFSAGAREYPIVFVMEQGKPTPVFLFGLRPGQNLMVSPEGGWLGAYLPRYLARYPFILAEIPEDRMILAIDQSAADDPSGNALFDETGEQSPFVTHMLALADAYARDARASDAFMARLVELDLLHPISVEIKAEGKSYGWSDLMAVDEARLAALPDDALLPLARNGYLAAIHSHLLSLQAFRDLQVRESKLETPASAA